MLKPRKIYIGGNIYGSGNIGDDAVLQGILRIIESAIPEAIITVGTYQGQRLEYLPPSLKYVNSYDMTQVRTAIKQSDCFISGGGTMIGDELNLSFPLGYNSRLISIAKLYGKRVAMLAIGANRVRQDEGVKIAKTITRLSDLITVRDEESRGVCLELGAKPSGTIATADPAFLLRPKETPRSKELKERLRARGKVFGINVVNEVWAHKDGYKIAIAKTCEYFSSRHGYTPVFFCNEIRPGNYFDFEANSQTAGLLDCEHELLEPIYYSPEEMIDILSTFEFVIGMRMHGLIFSAVAGIPFVAVSRVDKVDNFMHLFGLGISGTVSHCDSKQLIADAEDLLKNRRAFQRDVAERVAKLREDCLKNVELLREMFNERRIFWHKINVSSLRFLMSTTKSYKRFQRLLRGEISFGRILRKLRSSLGQKGAN